LSSMQPTNSTLVGSSSSTRASASRHPQLIVGGRYAGGPLRFFVCDHARGARPQSTAPAKSRPAPKMHRTKAW
jgi:hypothetical protein